MRQSLCILSTLMTVVKCIPELQFLHVVFAHKTYAPISDVIGEKDTNLPKEFTYEYFNSAAVNMPNAGKINMYNLGVYLRETYGRFLGDIYTDKIAKMRTTEHALSMMAAQIVNAGLWPATQTQKWSNDTDWQPIPTDYVEARRDALLLGISCPSFIYEMRNILETKEVQKRLFHHLPLFDYVSHYTGMKIHLPSEIALLYASLETKADLNQSLPHWSNDLFPHGEMYNVSLLEYDLLSRTPLQKKLNGGSIIKEIIANSLKHIQGMIPKERKIMLYSGDERNIVGVLKNLNLWSAHIPQEAASIIFEMYFENETQSHGMKVNYYTGMESESIPLKIPHCKEFCSLKTFITLLFDVIPENEDLLCNFRIPNLPDNEMLTESIVESDSSSSFRPTNILILLLLSIILTGQ